MHDFSGEAVIALVYYSQTVVSHLRQAVGSYPSSVAPAEASF